MRFPSPLLPISWVMAASFFAAATTFLPAVGAADICFAIDVSSTICRPPGSQSSCWLCKSECRNQLLSTDTCCDDFKYQIEYARKISTEASESDPNSNFALVTFHGAVVENSNGLVDLASFNGAIDTAKYYGGWRNTGGAMNKCLEYLNESSASSKSIVLMTEGMPSAGAPDQTPGGWNTAHREYAKAQTSAALNRGINVIPVIIGASSTHAAFLVTLATDIDNGVLLFSDQSDLQDPYDILDILEIRPTGGTTSSADAVAMCFVLDMSGSICSPPGISTSCWNCLSECRDSSLTQNMCCPSFKNQVDYAKLVANELSAADPFATFGLVTFHRHAIGQTNEMVSIHGFNQAIGDTKYNGGWRNLGGGIKKCKEFLSQSSSTNKFIVTMTDGPPTAGDDTKPNGKLPEHATYACNQAATATSEGITMLPILVGTSDPNSYSLSCLSDNVITVADQSDLNNPDQIAQEVSFPDRVDLPNTPLQSPEAICGKSFSGDGRYRIDVASDIVDCSKSNIEIGAEAFIVLSGNVVLDCDGAVIRGNADKIGVILNDSASIENCEFSGFDSGIYLGASSGDRTISNIKISKNQVHGIFVKDSTGEIVIKDVIIEDNVYYGILFDGVTTGRNTVEGAIIRRNSQGMMIKRRVTGTVVVIDSTFDDNHFHGMVIQSKESVEVRGGEFINNVRHGILATRFGANGPLLISGIKARYNHESGVVLSGTQQVTVENSDISDNKNDGVYAKNSDVTISCSAISRNQRNGVFNDSRISNTVQIMNSRVDDNTDANLMTLKAPGMTLTNVRACGGDVRVSTNSVSGVTCDNGSCGRTCGGSTSFDVSGTCTDFPPSTF